MNNRSRKHHYLPRNFLKGFTDDKRCFFVYDKQKDRIFYTSPLATFFENDLNTILLPKTGYSDFLEKLYADTERVFWNSLDKISNSNPKNPIELLDKMHLFLFLLFQHWRLPRNIEYLERLSEELFPTKDGNFDFLSLVQKNGEKASEEITEVMRKSDAFRKLTKVVAPFVPFYKDTEWANKLNDWKFFYTGDNGNWYMIGDSPIITTGLNNHDPIDCLSEFVFSVSGKILLVNYKKAAKKDLPEEFILNYSTAVIENATRFIACHNKKFLEMLVERHKIYKKFNKTANIIPEMFKSLE